MEPPRESPEPPAAPRRPRGGREWQIVVGAIVVAIALALAVGGGIVVVRNTTEPTGPPPRVPVGLDIYRGLGTWIDIYDHEAWADPEGTVRDMAGRGIRTLYLETSNFGHEWAFTHRDGVERFLDAAHAEGIAVVAWYLPGFDDVQRDLERSLAAIELRTDAGNRFDSFALDIESPEVSSPERRTERLIAESKRLRRAAGRDYPLGAIVPSPPAMATNPEYWPGFPYRSLGAIYDVFLPMTYYTWRVSGAEAARDYSLAAVRIIRDETGNPDVAIHVIGGLAGQAKPAETRSFVRAMLHEGVVGASYYDFTTTRERQWRTLRELESLAGPSPTPAVGPTGTATPSATASLGPPGSPFAAP